MKLFQSDLEEIQKKTKKEYEVDYSNNAESEYVKIYDDNVSEEIILDLLERVDDLERELEHKKEELEDIKQDIEDNYTRKSIASQVGITDRDFV